MQRPRTPPATIFLLATTALLLGCGSEASIDATADGALSSGAGLSARPDQVVHAVWLNRREYSELPEALMTARVLRGALGSPGTAGADRSR